MRGRTLAAALVIAAAVALGGCAASAERGGSAASGVGGVPGATDVASADARRVAFDAFDVGGALGYWDEAQNVSARIDWHEEPGATELLLTGPLGLGALTLTEDAGGATLVRRGAEPVSGVSAGALLQRELGLAAPVPLDAARDWLRGLPGDGASDVRRDASGRLETVLWTDATGARWFARVRRWTDVDGFELPALVTARSGERHLRLALSDWRPAGASASSSTGPPAGASVGPSAGPPVVPPVVPDGSPGAAPATPPDSGAVPASPPGTGRGRLEIPGR